MISLVLSVYLGRELVGSDAVKCWPEHLPQVLQLAITRLEGDSVIATRV